jgi:hypothetical protein
MKASTNAAVVAATSFKTQVKAIFREKRENI